jgi:hypothetical protein
MGDTWVTDMRHYLDEDGCLGEMTNQALNLALFFGSIVGWMTSHETDPSLPSNVPCRRSPGHSRCVGEIYASFEVDPRGISWFCPLCLDNGLIHGWEGTLWDRRPQK